MRLTGRGAQRPSVDSCFSNSKSASGSKGYGFVVPWIARRKQSLKEPKKPQLDAVLHEISQAALFPDISLHHRYIEKDRCNYSSCAICHESGSSYTKIMFYCQHQLAVRNKSLQAVNSDLADNVARRKAATVALQLL